MIHRKATERLNSLRDTMPMSQGHANLSVVSEDDDGFSFRNGILANLSADDLRVLSPHLERVEIRARSILQEANKRVEYVHFIEHGLVSRTAGSRGCSIETAMIGRFGYTGVALVLGSTLSTQRSIVRLPGTALRIQADELCRILQSRPQIRAEMLQFVQSLITQYTQGVLCAAKHDIDRRLARWLLLASDRMQSNVLMVTHDLLAMIMGVRRAGITDALLRFEADGVVKKARGTVQLTNRPALEARACDCYGIVRDAYVRWKQPRCDGHGAEADRNPARRERNRDVRRLRGCESR
jgi:CRP-like cAMP-binding protein